jgi:FKBP-type peptidyl-prolyl cis-trans isomerase FkpA/FKBP-type peptidyl-prolyl cis-trans isomerase FklB
MSRAPASVPRPEKTVAPNGVSRLWLAVAVLSLGGNAVLLWRFARPSATAHPPAVTAPAAPARPVSPAPDVAPYAALGTFVAENNRIPDLHWTPAQFEAFISGERASYEGRGYAMDDDAKKLRDDINSRVQKLLEKERPDPVQDYFRDLREKEHVLSTASGLHYRITDEGTGSTPTATSRVLISYAARLPSGESVPALSRNRVSTSVADLLPGLREGVQLFRPGGKGLVYVPAKLSFGDGEWPAEVPRGAPIIFYLELHDVSE